MKERERGTSALPDRGGDHGGKTGIPIWIVSEGKWRSPLKSYALLPINCHHF